MKELDFRRILDIVKDSAPFFEDYEAASRISSKEGAANFVTEADVKVQSYFLEKLGALYPDIPFMGEEKDNSDVDPGRPFWILDPVDGTTNLIHHFTHSAVSLALAAEGEIQAGIVYNPYAGELFYAQKGRGAYLNGRPIHVSQVSSMADSLISVGTTPYRRDRAEQIFAWCQEVFLKCQDIRRIGSAAIDLAYVACGRTEAFFELSLNPWDFAAGLLLIQEAGGRVTDFQGRVLAPSFPSSVIGTNGSIHDELLSVLQG